MRVKINKNEQGRLELSCKESRRRKDKKGRKKNKRRKKETKKRKK